MSRRGGAIVALAIAGVMLCACGNKNAYTQSAMKSIEELDYESATALLDEAENNRENERLIDRARGLVSMGGADYETASDYFIKALTSGKGNVGDFEIDTSYYLGASEYKSGKYEDALQTYSAIIGMREKDEKAYFLRGATYLCLDKHDEAIRDFNSAIAITPNNPDLYIKIYEELDDAGYTDDGKDYLDRAKSLDVKLTDYQKGQLNYYSGDYEEARSYLEKARMAGDDNSVLYLGRAYEALGDMNYAASLYKTYLEKHPDDSVVYNQLGLCQLDSNDYEGALDSFEKGLEIGNNSTKQSLRYNEIVAYEFLSDFKKAAVLMQGYLADYPDDAQAVREYEFLKTR